MSITTQLPSTLDPEALALNWYDPSLDPGDFWTQTRPITRVAELAYVRDTLTQLTQHLEWCDSGNYETVTRPLVSQEMGLLERYYRVPEIRARAVAQSKFVVKTDTEEASSTADAAEELLSKTQSAMVQKMKEQKINVGKMKEQMKVLAAAEKAYSVVTDKIVNLEESNKKLDQVDLLVAAHVNVQCDERWANKYLGEYLKKQFPNLVSWAQNVASNYEFVKGNSQSS